MKILRRLLLFICIIAVFSLNVFAEDTKTVTIKAEYDGENITVTEDSLISEIDNSNLEVKVIRVKGETETTIYTGLLGGYDNGAWVHTDFSEIQFMVIYNWETVEDEAIYIIPIQNMPNESTVISSEHQLMTLNSEVVQPSLNITTKFYVNNIETPENSLGNLDIVSGDTIMAQYTITNSDTVPQNVQLIMCLYGVNSKLLTMGMVSDTILASETKTVEKSYTVSSDISKCSAKVMLWNSMSGLQPLYEVKHIGKEVTEQVATATLDCMLNREYNLVMTAQNIPVNDDGNYTLKYDPAKLDVLDLCSLTYEKELDVGSINGTDIIITSFDSVNGIITFSNINNTNESVSTVINSVKFKGLTSNIQTVIRLADMANI